MGPSCDIYSSVLLSGGRCVDVVGRVLPGDDHTENEEHLDVPRYGHARSWTSLVLVL